MAKHLSSTPARIKPAKTGKSDDNENRTSRKTVFWTVHPKPNACDKCKALEGIRFDQEPERPHPNCRCEIKKIDKKPETRFLWGFLSGFEDSTAKLFWGLGHVKVTITHMTGALASGVRVYSNMDGMRESHTLGGSVTFHFGTLTDTPVLWNIRIVQKGADNTMISYQIEYEITEP